MVEFPCGCKIDPDNIDPYHLNFHCDATYEMLRKGLTRGVWQLETNFGRTQTKKLQPTELNDLIALGALLRPGVSEALDADGSTMMAKYCLRKNGLEEVRHIHPSLEPILKETYSVLLYQEDATKVCMDLAGFTYNDAEVLRKAAGKKDTEKMAKVKTMFLDGSKKIDILDEESAAKIWTQMEASQRYAFNKAHSASYGIYTFATAWFKAHFPLEFFCSYLGSAKEKSDPIEEMHELVNECKLLDIEVLPPDFRWQEANFHIKDNKIYFGMGNVKGIGQSKIKKLFNLCQDTPVEELDWFSLLLNVFSGLDITIVENLILVGAFDYLKIPRIRMHYEYGVWNRLTEKEQDWIKTTSTQNSILEAIREAAKPRKEGGACANKNRIAELEDLIKILEHPPFALKDSTGKIAIDEQRLLGISLTAHETDSGSSEATCSCKEFLGGFSGNIVLAVTITRMNEYKTKKGKNPGQAMAFLTVEDISCALDSLVVFPEVYAEFKSLLVKDNTVLIYGNRSKENSLIVQKVIQI